MSRATLLAMRPDPSDDSLDSSAGIPRQWAALRAVPASGKPGDSGLDDPLRLGRAMRLRLLAAVQALLADPSIAGQSDVARLAAVVLYAKSRAPKGAKNDNQTSIWVAELGRWMGVGESTVNRRVLAAAAEVGRAAHQGEEEREGASDRAGVPGHAVVERSQERGAPAGADEGGAGDAAAPV